MWLLFVPVSVFLFGRTLEQVYGLNYIVKFIEEFFGVQYFFVFYGFNGAWWFISCIITLYLLFPFIYILLEKFNSIFVIFIFGLSLMSVNISFSQLQPYEPIRDYLFTFVFGMYIAKSNFIEKFGSFEIKKVYLLLLQLIVFVVFVFIKSLLTKKALIITDGVFSFTISTTIYLINRDLKFLDSVGKHSFNIYLFHVFIYSCFFPEFIYYFKNPFVILTILLTSCLMLSFLIELFKRKIGFYKLQSYIINK